MEENAYKVLGLEAGPDSSEADIKKAYRKLALVKHPDKNRDNPNAAAEFSELQKAYDILTDAEARKALDDLLKAKAQRAERAVFRDEKRRRMMDELVKREQAVERERSQEEVARAKLRAEIERLRRQAAEREAKQYAEQRKAAAEVASAAAPGAAGAGASGGTEGQQVQQEGMAPEMQDKLSRMLKEREYSVAELRAAFAPHGVVEDVVIREGKKKKGSALVVMATRQAAAAAAGSVCGDLSSPLLVVPFPKVPVDADEPIPRQLPVNSILPLQPVEGARATAAPLFPAVVAPGAAGAYPAGPSGGLGSSACMPPRQTVPLFAAGTSLNARLPATPLFPGAAAGAAASMGGAAGGGKPEEACPAGGASERGWSGERRPLFPASFCAGTAAPPSLGSFGSYRAPTMQSAGALNRGLEDGVLQKMRQAAERQRLIQELQKEEGLS